ncbi:MAG: N-acetylmannosamine-6-phosphate 2-epimerase [Bifidobacteriaceae bacterium]|jgi:N-acylglucosamine-6-phosphate 2-epimerase|nr:N-acetylmannosamine-6-phosphate 2-epimerase [Bifidobacteriaceae bacterium]MCI1914727.1 N-acetylmannosamine-6-phosphate 2-epimerase [Bifidobacteriaceae bacterium]
MTTTAAQKSVIEKFKGKLIVSSQAYPGEPMRHPETMAQIALSAQIGGAAAIRCQGLSDIAAIKGMVQVPVIGIWKEGEEGVFITPTVRHARCCMAAGADIVALDATSRPRPDGRSLKETAAILKDEGAIIMADCASFDDAQNAVDAGFDIISTTLSGYAPGRPALDGPDLELLGQMIDTFPDTPVICEGRIHTPKQAAKVMEMGAWACVVGTAITHPTSITKWFKAAVDSVAR